MFAKDTLTLLAEAANLDMSNDTESAITEGQIKSVMESIEEVSEEVVITAEMVSVIAVGEDYLVEINNLLPFMKSAEIKSVGEALDAVSRVNGLPDKSVGLLIESDDFIDEKCEAAKCKKDKKSKNKILDKINKSVGLSDKLKKQGYTVKKKKCKGKSKKC